MFSLSLFSASCAYSTPLHASLDTVIKGSRFQVKSDETSEQMKRLNLCREGGECEFIAPIKNTFHTSLVLFYCVCVSVSIWMVISLYSTAKSRQSNHIRNGSQIMMLLAVEQMFWQVDPWFVCVSGRWTKMHRLRWFHTVPQMSELLWRACWFRTILSHQQLITKDGLHQNWTWYHNIALCLSKTWDVCARRSCSNLQ